jgi:hypothetical protein
MEPTGSEWSMRSEPSPTWPKNARLAEVSERNVKSVLGERRPGSRPISVGKRQKI